jgi:hypothetical protein
MEAVRSNKANLRKLERFGFLVRRYVYPEPEPGLVMCVCSPPLETGKARSGFGAKPEKQFLF